MNRVKKLAVAGAVAIVAALGLVTVGGAVVNSAIAGPGYCC